LKGVLGCTSKTEKVNLTIVKYNAGNIQSVLYALQRIGVSATVTDDHELIRSADKVIFPGVGEASSAMRYLQDRGLDKVLTSLQCPVLGICLGMQLMCRHSQENDTTCLNIFDADVKHFSPTAAGTASDIHFKVPQIGWNTIFDLQTNLFKGVDEGSYCYFVHGYYADRGKHSIATTQYNLAYSSALQKDNFYGVQFHPEKSARVGAQILSNFLAL
jgi:imidazole glycerol-phosphate synthase subunit HisH